MIFIYNLVFILFVGYFNKNRFKQDKNKKLYLFICFFQMALIQGVRSFEVGTDTMSYMIIYENFLRSDYYAWRFTHYEIGFQAVYRILQFFHVDSQMVLFIFSICIMIGFANFIYINSKDIYLSTFLFASIFYPNSFNVIRQYLALAIAINSYQYIIQKKYYRAIILIILGSTIHVISVLAFIPLGLCVVKNWKLLRNILTFLCIFFLMFSRQIVSTLLRIIGKTYYLTGFNVERLFRMTTLITFLIAVLSWYFSKKEVGLENMREMNCLSCIAFVNFLVGLLYLKFEFISRVIEVLNVYILTMIPLGMNTIKCRYKNIITMLIYIIPIFLMLMAVFNSGSGVEVYKMFWMTSK